jgi:hypothetical protein
MNGPGTGCSPQKAYIDEGGKTLKHPQLLRVLAGLFVQGRTRYEEVELFRSDALFHRSLELPYALAAETLRLYAEQMIDQQDAVQLYLR